ncbi:MAG: class I SAM-dependent methyltransferase [Xanthobacteraceae bacterium]
MSQVQPAPFEPYSGQPGKDVIWVPTPDVLVEKMLDMAVVTPQDYVIDLGSGDGRMVIAAAKRGVRSLGVEYNPQMVELSTQRAHDAGVGSTARFVHGDMYEADISAATVLALFLLPENLDRLAPKFLDLNPGTRIVLNKYLVSGWTPDRSEQVAQDCGAWCSAHPYIVPAKVEGNWRMKVAEQEGALSLIQIFQIVRGELTLSGRSMPVENGRMHADRIEFDLAGIRYSGRVNGDKIIGGKGGAGTWTAVRRAR